MRIFDNRSGKGELLIAALAVSAVLAGGCSSRSEKASNTPPEVAAAPEASPSPAQQAAAKATVTAQASPEVSTRQNTRLVLSQIHQAEIKEIAMGQIAEEKASTDQVRAFATQLVQDDTNADQMVVAMAQKVGARMHSLAASHSKSRAGADEQKLKSAKGAEFDRLFLKMTSADHERLITMLQKAREDASDDELEALIDKIVPILQQHKELAQILMKKEQA
jgi:putative membrane protein